MDSIRFEHEGIQYEVFPLTEFQKSLYGAMIVDLVKEITGQHYNDAPLSAKRLAEYYIEWNIASCINGERFNFLSDVTVEKYQTFALRISQDNELASKWFAAYKEANMEQTDPNAPSAEQDSESE